MTSKRQIRQQCRDLHHKSSRLPGNFRVSQLPQHFPSLSILRHTKNNQFGNISPSALLLAHMGRADLQYFLPPNCQDIQGLCESTNRSNAATKLINTCSSCSTQTLPLSLQTENKTKPSVPLYLISHTIVSVRGLVVLVWS